MTMTGRVVQPGDQQVALMQSYLMRLVAQHGQRDPMSGITKASLVLPIDKTHEMVVTAKIHDRRRERVVVWIATSMAIVSTLAVVFLMGNFWNLVSHG